MKFSKSPSIGFHLIWSGLALNALILLVLSNSPDWIEIHYSQWLYPHITAILSGFSALAPFSFTEIGLYLLILSFLVSVVLMFRDRSRWRKIARGWLIGVLWLVTWFYLAWGLNYFRKPLSRQLSLSIAQVDTTALIEAFERSVQEANRLSESRQPLPIHTIDRDIETGIRQLQEALPFISSAGKRRPKQFLLNFWLNKTLTTGFFSPIFHEVHLNAELLDIEYPFTLAHEKFHQLGFANEAEANFLAFLVCASSRHELIRYSAYLAAVRYLGARARLTLRDYDHYAAKIAPPVRRDFERIRKRWLRHTGRISRISRKTYDHYLKMNKIKEGMENYAGMVELLIGYWLPRARMQNGSLPQK